MMRSRLTGLPSLDSSFQFVLRSTPLSRGAFASSSLGASAVHDVAKVHGLRDDRVPACLRRYEELVLVRITVGNLAGDPVRDRPRSTSSAKRSERRFRKNIEEMWFL